MFHVATCFCLHFGQQFSSCFHAKLWYEKRKCIVLGDTFTQSLCTFHRHRNKRKSVLEIKNVLFLNSNYKIIEQEINKTSLPDDNFYCCFYCIESCFFTKCSLNTKSRFCKICIYNWAYALSYLSYIANFGVIVTGLIQQALVYKIYVTIKEICYRKCLNIQK